MVDGTPRAPSVHDDVTIQSRTANRAVDDLQRAGESRHRCSRAWSGNERPSVLLIAAGIAAWSLLVLIAVLLAGGTPDG